MKENDPYLNHYREKLNKGLVKILFWTNREKTRRTFISFIFHITHAGLYLKSFQMFILNQKLFFVTYFVNQSKLQLKKLAVHTYVYPNFCKVHTDLSKKVINEMVDDEKLE